MPLPWRSAFARPISTAEPSYRLAKMDRPSSGGRRLTKLVVAVGGNALLPPGEPSDVLAQRKRSEATSARLADLVKAGHDVVVAHGNGPQVGNILLQNEESRHIVPPMPLDVCGAESQAQIGYLLGQRSEEHTSELQSRFDLVCRLLLEKKKKKKTANPTQQ